MIKKFITDNWHNEECFIECDCGAEGLNIFLDIPTMNNIEPTIGFVYFEAFETKHTKDDNFYFEFDTIDDFDAFMNALKHSIDDGEIEFAGLRNNYVLEMFWEKNTLILDIHKYKYNARNDTITIKTKKPVIEISLEADKVKELKTELESWFEVHDN